MRNIDIIKGLSRAGKTFTMEDAAIASGLGRESVRVMLNRMERKGWIERIERGKYLIVPLEAKKGEYTLNEFYIGSILVKDYSIAYWSALNYYGLTEQIPGKVFIQTTARKKNKMIEVFGVGYRLIRIKPSKMFGITTQWIEDAKINITDMEKTIVDCLDKPQYCGGIIEVAKALNNPDLDLKKVLVYCGSIGNSGVLRRFGYICDVLSIDLDIPRHETRNYLYLDPTMPHRGKKNSKWRLVDNLGDILLEEIG